MNSSSPRMDGIRLERASRVGLASPTATETPTMRRFLTDALTTLAIALFMGLAWVL